MDQGETLAHRLEKGALPLEPALRTASEVADALDKAHRQSAGPMTELRVVVNWFEELKEKMREAEE